MCQAKPHLPRVRIVQQFVGFKRQEASPMIKRQKILLRVLGLIRWELDPLVGSCGRKRIERNASDFRR